MIGRLLLLLSICWFLRGWWLTVAPRLVFAEWGDRAGFVGIRWFAPWLRGYGGRIEYLWFPRPISRWLWLRRSAGNDQLARWLRAQAD